MSAESIQSNLFFDCLDNQFQKLNAEEINYNFTVKGSIGYHDLNIQYQNINSCGNVQFLFCLSEDTCFDHLSVKVDEKIINCVVKEKEEAKQEYENDIKQGLMASLGQLDDSRGYFRVDIGNIDANKDFVVSFKYIEQLQLIDNCYIMNFPFKQSTNSQYQFKKLNIVGDIYCQKETDEIISTNLQNYKNNSTIKFTKVSKNHHKFTATFEKEIVDISKEQYTLTTSLKVKYEKENIALLSSFQNDSEISPYCALINYVPQLYAVKKSLFDFSKNQANLIKSEFIIIIDRSGSMHGQRIQMAKESLVFFLKSLPEGSIYNIISFGTSYKFMYDQSMQFNDQNIQDSLEKIKQFDADMGGTYISTALQELFQNLQDQYGLRKKIYILTDGEFSDNEQVKEVVEKYKQRCEINILSIGIDVHEKNSKLLTQKTGGYVQTVKSESQITSSVIQLLTDSFQNYQGVSMKLQSDHDDSINYIIPDPNQIQYVDTTKTLRFYVFFNRKLEDYKKVNFKLETSFQNKSFKSDWSIDIDSQISSEQAHIHKMGLYAMIRQLIINKKRKTENILDDISCAIKVENDKLKDLFTNEAIRYQILCEFTAFVGKEQKTINKLNELIRSQEIMLNQISSQVSNCSYSANNFRCITTAYPKSQAPRGNQSISLCSSSQYYHKSKSSAGCCGGGGSSYNSSQPKSKQRNSSTIQLGSPSDDQKSIDQNSSYSKIISMQQAKGLWKYSTELLSLLQISEKQFKSSNKIDTSIPDYENIWITFIIIHWLKEFCQKDVNKHQYVLLKAIGIIDRLKKQYDIEDQDKSLKDLFKNYKKDVTS